MAADVMQMNPAHVIVYSVTGFGNSSAGSGLFMLGMGSAAALYMISRSKSLLNATDSQAAVAKAYTGDKNSPKIPESSTYYLPKEGSKTDPNGKPWSQYAIAQWTTWLASQLVKDPKTDSEKAKNAEFNSYIQAWNTQAGLLGTQKEAASSEINSWSKGESSMIQEAQQVVQSVPNIGSTAINYLTSGAQLISTPM